jgi:hypothetical protein
MIAEQVTLQKKLHYILHRALVDTRNLALAKDHERIYDLADTFEILPSLIEQWEDAYMELIRRTLAAYQSKYEGQVFNYLSILNMSDRDFEEIYATW